jgi:hypothetical protein
VAGVKLPNAHLAVVEREKITGYLLNAAHPDNGGKAAFFQTQGFAGDHWHGLAEALRHLALTGEVAKRVESRHGQKYVVDGKMETPNKKSPWVRTVWIVDRGLDKPRLVTAYPHEPQELA